jgi:uncharacterized protein
MKQSSDLTNSGLTRIAKSWFIKLLLAIFAIATLSLNCIAPALATGVYDLPSPNTEDVWVVDTANEISLDTQNKLSSQFQDLAAKTGQEIRMVAIRRLDYGETINSLADEIFTTWYTEPSARENQTLLVMDTLTNTTAIRTGAKAANLVNPEMIQSIIQDTVGYNLRTGNKYNQALLESSDRLVAVLSGEADPGPAEVEEEIQVEGTFTKAEDTDAGFAWTWVIVLLLLATVIPMVTYFWYVM